MLRSTLPRFGARLTICALIVIVTAPGPAIAQDLPIRSNGPISLPGTDRGTRSADPLADAPPGAPGAPGIPGTPGTPETEHAQDAGPAKTAKTARHAQAPAKEARHAQDAETARHARDEKTARHPSAAPAAVAAAAPVAPSEHRALGVPNGPLSATPVSAGPSPDGRTLVDRLRDLDPRRNEVMRVAGALAVVLGLMLLVRVLLRRANGALGGGSRPAGVLQVLARYPVARGQSLLLLKMSQRVLLVHHSGTTMTTLSEVTDRDEVAVLLAGMEAGSRSREAARFRSVLRSFEREHERAGSKSRPAGGGSPDVEIVDLTRSQVRGFGSLLPRRRLPA